MNTTGTDVQESNERLLKALFSNKGLTHLVEVGAAELGNPVLVVDPTYHYAARAGIELDDADDSAFARFIRSESTDEVIADEGIRYIKETGVDEELARAHGAVLRHNPLYDLDTLTQDVVAEGICLGRVMALAKNHPFGEADRAVFDRLVALVAQELQKGGFLSSKDSQAGPYFLARLLDDEQPNPMHTARRMKLVGFSPLSTLFVVTLRRRGGDMDGSCAQRVRAHLSGLLAHSLSTIYDNELVCLVSRTDEPVLPARDEEALVRAAASNGLLVGISNAFSEVTDVRPHLEQARSAIRYGSTYTKILDDTGVYRYCEYTYMEMLDICNDHVNLMNYCHPAVWALWEYDQAHGTELVETLFAYMQNSCNTARTSALLSLHKNTLLYRLGRIREVTGNDLASGEDLFLFHLSIRVLLYLGILETRTKPRSSADLHLPAE